MMRVLQISVLLALYDWSRSQTVETTHGKVQGTAVDVDGNKIFVFYGIPYAKPAVFPLRFKKPEPAKEWSPDVLDATSRKASCILPSNLHPVKEPYLEPLTKFDEDCLTLTIWTPDPDSVSGLPVIVGLSGVDYSTGSANLAQYSGKYLAGKMKVVVVTINSRQGVMGFSYIPDVIPANIGLLDQVMALTWISKNIKAFGGDPSSVTIFGQGTGGAAVGFLLLAPSAATLFKRAVLLSGVPNAHSMYDNATTVTHNVKKLAKEVDCPVDNGENLLSCFNSMNIQELVDKQFDKYIPFVPVVDGEFLPDDPVKMLKSGTFKKTDILHGVVKDEATLLFLQSLLGVLGLTSPPVSVEVTEHQYWTLLTDLLSRQATQLNGTILNTYYVNGELPPAPPPTDYLTALNQIWSDIEIKCPAVDFASHVSTDNAVYQFRFNYRSSLLESPKWMGAYQSSELAFFLGIILDPAFGFSVREQRNSQTMMNYLVNFCKSGDPNSPDAVSVKWPVHEATDKYLNIGTSISTSAGLRQSQCVFINEILPQVPLDGGGESGVAVPTLNLIYLLVAVLPLVSRD